MHHTTPPTEQQQLRMDAARVAADTYAKAIDALLPDTSPRKKHVMHKLYAVEMVINAVITHTDYDTHHERIRSDQSRT